MCRSSFSLARSYQSCGRSCDDLKDDFEVGDEWRLEVTSDMQSARLYVVQFNLKRMS
jgi:hypothetical protein